MLNQALFKKEVQDFIKSNLKSDLPALILKGSPFNDISIQELAVQIKGAQIARRKFPTFSETERIIYPPKLNLEQTSSEIAAKYKASLIAGKTGIDLTGGLGIDTYFISRNFDSFNYCEMNSELAQIALHNFQELKANNIKVYSINSLLKLKEEAHHYDSIYCDPARRDNQGGKVYKLQDCLPDIPSNIDLLLSRSNKVLIKTSPILDLSAGLKELKNVKEIHIVAIGNEVKELLWIVENGYQDLPRIKTINFEKNSVQTFDGDWNDTPKDVVFSNPVNFLYEPNAAIMKSGMFSQLTHSTQTKKLHQHSHLYTSETLKNFPGRSFEIIDIVDYNPSDLKRRLKSSKANITIRNFGESVEQIRKRFKIKDGGSDYIFFTTNKDETRKVIFCKKAPIFSK